MTHQRVAIGISVKYANTCNINITSRDFLSESDIQELKRLQYDHPVLYIEEMRTMYGSAKNWFRKRKLSDVTNQFIDLIRNKVMQNWQCNLDRQILLSKMLQMNSPIPYWTYEFKVNGQHKLYTAMPVLTPHQMLEVTVSKYQGSFIGFCINGRCFGLMQVKFNNGILERHKLRRTTPDFTVDDIQMKTGDPFSSWNFSIDHEVFDFLD